MGREVNRIRIDAIFLQVGMKLPVNRGKQLGIKAIASDPRGNDVYFVDASTFLV